MLELAPYTVACGHYSRILFYPGRCLCGRRDFSAYTMVAVYLAGKGVCHVVVARQRCACGPHRVRILFAAHVAAVCDCRRAVEQGSVSPK